MKFYKIKIELRSALVTPLKGDTIWGHIIWGIANHEGDNAVTEFLEQNKKLPNLIVSSAFPKGYICKNIPELKKREGELSIAKYSEIKNKKKEKFMKASDFFVESENISCEDEAKSQKPFSENQVTHNSINRFSGTVEEGALFSTFEKWSEIKDFDIYVVSEFDIVRIKTLFTWAFENGFGADSSVGKGQIKVGEVTEVQPKLKGSKYMALAPFVVSKYEENEISDLRSDIFVRTGKIGGAFVSNSMSPYKKTVMLFEEGAVFTCVKEKLFVGELLQNVHIDSRICQAGFAPVIPID